MKFREYDFIEDPEKITKHLFTLFQGAEMIEKLREADLFFLDDPDNRKRFVVEVDAELHATCVVLKENIGGSIGKYSLHSVVASEEYQGKGLAIYMIENIFSWVRDNGGRMVILSTEATNTRARKFYEKLGFLQYGVLPKGYKKNNDEYIDEILYYIEL